MKHRAENVTVAVAVTLPRGDWQRYKEIHSFLNPSDSLLVSALAQSGLKAWLKRDSSRRSQIVLRAKKSKN